MKEQNFKQKLTMCRIKRNQCVSNVIHLLGHGGLVCGFILHCCCKHIATLLWYSYRQLLLHLQNKLFYIYLFISPWHLKLQKFRILEPRQSFYRFQNLKTVPPYQNICFVLLLSMPDRNTYYALRIFLYFLL